MAAAALIRPVRKIGADFNIRNRIGTGSGHRFASVVFKLIRIGFRDMRAGGRDETYRVLNDIKCATCPFQPAFVIVAEKGRPQGVP